MTDIQLYTKLSSLPENLKKEVEDFIDFLKSKSKQQPQPPAKKQREFDLAKGMIKIMPNFDDPIEDFQDYM